jgi:hypothetical protein
VTNNRFAEESPAKDQRSSLSFVIFNMRCASSTAIVAQRIGSRWAMSIIASSGEVKRTWNFDADALALRFYILEAGQTRIAEAFVATKASPV